MRIVPGNLAGYSEQRSEQRLAEAYARGVAEGSERALREAGTLIESLQRGLEDTRRRLLERSGEEAVRLSLEIARHLLRSELQAGRYDLERIVRETLHASGVGRGSCVVHLNPADVEKLAHVAFRSGTKIEADPEVSCGDVHVSNEHGLLVRDIDECLESIGERLRELAARSTIEDEPTPNSPAAPAPDADPEP